MRFYEPVLYIYVLVVVTIFSVVQYISLRARNARAVPPDPQIGRKFILAFFLHLAVILLLAGLTISSLDWSEHFFEPLVEAQQARKEADRARALGEEPTPNPAAGLPPPVREVFNEKQRAAAGFAASGLFHILVFWPLLRFATNAREFPAVGRSFVGIRLFACGLMVMTLTTVSLVGAFQKGDTDLSGASVIAGLAVVWCPAALFHLVALLASRHWYRGARRDEPED